MKKLFIAAALMLGLITATFAKTDNLYKFSSVSAFKKQFPTATDITAKKVGVLTKISFTYNNVATDAFYNAEDELVITSHPIDLNALPSGSLEKINSKYQGATITEAIEFNNLDEDTSCYYLSLSKDNRRIILQVNGNGSISVKR